MPVVGFVALLFICLPLIEIFVLIEVGRAIGAIPTIALVILTAVAGTWLVRAQGLQTLTRVQASINRGELPAVALIETFILVIAGILLVLPGFTTDMLGFVCLLPPIRRALALRLATGLFQRKAQQRRSNMRTLEGEYRIEDEL